VSEIAARLDRLPLSRFHLQLLVIGGLGFLFEAMDVAIVAFVLPAIRVQWALGNETIGLLAGASALGGMAGALMGGALGDRFGRKKVMLWALAVYTLATLACALAQSWPQFLIFRIIAGAGTAAEAIIIAPYLIEFVPPKVRGRFMGVMAAFLSLGYIAAALIGFLVVPGSQDGWRHALVIAALPILALLWWRRSLPESPRWLEARGRHAEAHATLERIEAKVARGGALPPISAAASVRPDESGTTGIADLFGSALRTRMFTAMTVCFAMAFGHYAFFSWIPSLLVERGLSVATSFTFSLAIYGAQLPGYLSAAWLNDAIGARRTIAVYMLASAAASAGLALAGSDQAILVGCILLSVFLNGIAAGIYGFVPVLFPTQVRATAQGVAGIATRCAAMISPIMIGLSLASFGFSGIFLVIGAVLAVGALPVLWPQRTPIPTQI
jgi:putative MFS transporter